ncbi:DUF6134 family protein [Owenweeksia hongkongensis]|uniref:DUF6134 family protein n=1 Tax=Owenweeksia hongkongensis TaxID=253245 RepID=UPI003A955739
MKTFIILAISTLFPFYTMGQTAKYIISLKGFEVGNQTVTQIVNNGITTVEVSSKATVKLGFTYTVSYHQLAHYDNQRLIESRVTIKKNDEIYSTSHTKWTGDHYRVMQDGKSFQIPGELHFATTRLYFQEPSTEHQRIYSEADCVIKLLEKSAAHTYWVSEPQTNRKSKYTYKNGILQEAIVDHALIDFVTKLHSYTP